MIAFHSSRYSFYIMEILKINPDDLRESVLAIEKAVEVIKYGGIVACPTDTTYGLIADATNEEAVSRLFKIKKRPITKAIPVIINNIELAKKIAFIDEKMANVLNMVWPGAVTVILQYKFKLPELITAGAKTVALRIPDYKLIYFLTESIGKPLTATSANVSGQQPAYSAKEVINQFDHAEYQPNLILDAGILKHSKPSTILDLSDREPKIRRVGPVDKETLLKILNINNF